MNKEIHLTGGYYCEIERSIYRASRKLYPLLIYKRTERSECASAGGCRILMQVYINIDEISMRI